jgi:NAD(P)-dependent dehydrogenase (short-subunit alcohol dehydrogenase family)
MSCRCARRPTRSVSPTCASKLDLLDPYDVAHAQTFDIDVLWNNAGVGESGPVVEIPIELVRRNYEVNVFKPIELSQGFIRKWVAAKKPAKIVFTSSMGGLFTPAYWGVYVSTKHALESVAEAMQQELKPYGIKVQTINPGAYYTGYNETMADTAFRWLDDARNFTKRAELRGFRRLSGRARRAPRLPGDDRSNDRDRPGRYGLLPQRRSEGDRGNAQGASTCRLGQCDLSASAKAATKGWA